MAADDAAVVVTLRANLKDYEAALKSAVRSTERAAAAAEKAISTVGKGGGASNVIQANFQKSSAAIANDARMLQFQLNDIFSGIASGQGIRAVQQQLGQIAQQMSGGGLAAGARTLGTAMIGMINPINLAVVAFGLAASAAAAYFGESEDGSKESEKTLKAQRDLIAEVAKQWGDALPALKAFNEELQRTEDIQKAIAAGEAVQAQTAESIRTALESLGMGRIEDAISAFGNFAKYKDDVAAWNTEWQTLQKHLDDGTLSLEEYQKFQEHTNKLLQELPMGGLEALQESWLKAQQAISDYIKTLQQSVEETAKLTDETAKLVDTINKMVPMAPSIGPPITGGAGVFNPSQTQLEEARRAAEEAERAARQATEENKREAERLAKEAADKLTEAIVRQSATAVDYAATMLGKSETANRGEINAFLKAGGIDLDAASTAWCAAFVNASLARVGIKGSGSNVATDFLKFGRAVNLPELQKGDILVQPRGRGAGEEGGHVGFATGQIRMLGDTIQQVELLSGNSADKVTTQWVDASTVIARRAADAFILPGEALDNLTAKSKTATDDMAKQWQQLNQQMAGAIGSGLSGFINDLIAGKDAGEAFATAIQRITSQLIDMAIQMLVIKPLMNALGGGIGGGGFLGGGLYHGGGTVGMSGRQDGRHFPAATWAGAPKYASGGMVGLRPGEVPIIAHRGEIIIPNARRLAGNAAGGGAQNHYSMDNANISIDMAGTGLVAADSSAAKQYAENVQKIIQAEMVRQSRPGGLLRKVPT